MDDAISERLQRYLNDQLPPAEAAEMERSIAEDDSVRNRYRQLATAWLLEDREVYWSLRFPAETAPGPTLGRGHAVRGLAGRPSSEHASPAEFAVSLEPTGTNPPSFRLKQEGWPEGCEPHGIILARINSAPREPLSFRVPASRLSPKVSRSPGQHPATGRADALSSPAYSLAADDGRVLEAKSSTSATSLPVGKDFRCQAYWQSGMLRVRASLPEGVASDIIWAELRAVGPSGVRTVHRTLLNVEAEAAGWTVLQLPPLKLEDATDVEFHLRSVQPDDVESLHALPVELVDDLLARTRCRTLLATPDDEGWEFSARWPSYQAALADPSHRWVLRVKPASKGGER